MEPIIILGRLLDLGIRTLRNFGCILGNKAQGAPRLFVWESKGTPMIWEEDYCVGNKNSPKF